MKTIFTNSYINKILRSSFTLCVFLLMSINAFSQITATEDFENETTANGSTPHTFSESGISFSTTLKFQISGVTGFGYSNSSNYIYLDNTTNGVGRSGTITISNASTAFKINSFASYVGSNVGGSAPGNGTITFVGTLAAGGTATATVNVPSSGTVTAPLTREANGMVAGLSFTGTPLDGVYITSLSVASSATIQFIELDHINFTTQAVVSNQISINDVTQNEGNSGTSNFAFTVTRTNNTAASSVNYATSNGTATAGSDYVANSGTVNFTAGGALTQTVNVVVNGDVTVEPNETFIVTLSSPSGGVLLDATGTGTIVDDDAINEPFDDETNLSLTFSQSGNNFQTTGKLNVVNNGGNFGAGGSSGYAASTKPYAVGNQGSLQITSAGKSFNIISVDLWAAAVSGTEPSLIYTPTNCTITFTATKADGSGTITHTAAITPTNPNVYSTVNFAGSPLAGVQLSAISFSTPAGIQYLQVDNFKYGTTPLTNTQLSISDESVVEGTGAGTTSAIFTITRTSNTTAFSVDVASSNGTATAGSDYTAFPTTTLNFTIGGALTQTVTVTILKDATIEPNETFTMTLSNATIGTLFLKQTGTGTILNDDSVVETFEDETNLATTFSENSVNFSASSGYRVRQVSTFGSGSSGFYLNSSNTTVGNMGTFSITSPNKAFKLNFLDAWVGTSPTTFSSGSVTFTGTLFGGGTVTTTKTITATSNSGAGWQQNISFTGTTLDNVLLTAIQVTTAGALTVCDIDNFNYTVVNTLPIIEVTDASNNAILNGGVAATGNNTNFGGACVSIGTISKTYTIKNSGNSNLTLSGSPFAVLSGADAGQFSITVQPTSPIIASGSTTFTVVYTPTTATTHNATITLTSNDGTNNPYVINIKGAGNPLPTITTSVSPAICTGATSFTIPYTATTGTPTTYSVSGTGITTASNTALPVTPITVNLSSAASGNSYSYTVTVKNANGCISSPVTTGSVTVNPTNTTSLTSAAGTNAQTVCINTAITDITYATTGATGATFSGLPAGVTGAWAGNVATLSGTPTTTTGSPFNYTVTLTGGCGAVTAIGTITVTSNNTITLTSAAGTNAQTKCVNTAITNITYATTGATGATFSGLPTGVTGAWISNVATISGTPTTAIGSPFNYTVTLTGGCGTVMATGTITVNSTAAPTSPIATPSNITVSGNTTTLTATGCNSPSTISWYDSSNPTVALPNNTPAITANKTFFAKCTGSNTCVSDASSTVNVTYNPCTPFSESPGNVNITWTGLLSTDWNTACNWSPAWVPDVSNLKAIIPNTTNKPVITGTVPDVNSIDVNLNALLTVNSGGALNIRENGGTNKGIRIDGGTLTNNGTINIESPTNTAINAYIYLTSNNGSSDSRFTNNGTVKINSSDEAIGVGIIAGGAFITNSATGIINIVNGIGVEVALASDIMTFINAGVINYNGSVLALSLQGTSSFTNTGSINVNSGTGITKTASVSINNNACGKIIMLAGTYTNAGITTNTGLIQIENALINNGTFTNTGVLKYGSLTGTVTNNKLIITNTCPIFTIGGSNNYTVSGIFTDVTATTSAGTYASNIFTANNTLPTGTQTLYASVTNETCSFIVPFTFINVKPTAVSISSTTACEGTSVNLLATCASGTPTWYAVATGGTALGTGSSFSYTPPAGESQTFYAACETTNCNSGRTVTSNSVTVSSVNTISITSFEGTNSQTVCYNEAITNITYSTTGATGATFSGLPTGVTGTWESNVVTISGTPTQSGTFNYTITLTGGCGTVTETGRIIVNEAIILTCPVNTTTTACQTQSAVNTAFAAWLATASASGGVNGVLTNNNTGAPAACGGSTTVTFTYTNTCSPLPTTCQATFTVQASPTVVLTCAVNTTAIACQTQAAVSTAFATWLATASASGGCNGVLTNNNTGAPSANGGSSTVTFTYTSTCTPLTTTCQATYIVSSPPTVVLTCPTNTTTTACQTQTAVNTAFATWLATASASGGCNGVLTNNNTGSPSSCGGSTTVTFTYTSATAPLITTCQATFTVPFPPTVVLTCPENTTTTACQTQVAVNTAFATWLATASASGGCNGVLTNNNTGAPIACGGSTTVTFTYTSTCVPLTTTCQATFIVPFPPTVVLTCPENTTTTANQTQATINTAFAAWLATASGNGGCNGVLTNNNTGAPLACGGATTVTFTYTSTCIPLTTTCQATFTVPVSTISITASNNSPICAGTTLSLNSGAGFSSYAWTGVNGFTSTAQNPTITNATVLATGTYRVIVTNVNGCTAMATTSATVNALPTVTASNNSPICQGTTLNLNSGAGFSSYAWTGVNGFTSTAQNPTITNATVLATGTYQVIVTNGNGCTAMATTSATVNALPTATASNNSPICAGITLSLSGGVGTANTYAWTGVNGFTSTAQNPTITNATVSATGTYKVIVTNESGCTAMATTSAIVNALPTATASNNSPICAGTTLSLNSGAGFSSYAWTGVNGFTSTAQNPTITNATVLATGTYRVIVTNVNGCTAMATTSATVNALPTVTASNNSPICQGTTLNLNSGAGFSSYAWTGVNSFTANTQNPSILTATPAATGTYQVIITDANGCTAMATTSATVNPTPVTPTTQADTQIIFGGNVSLTATGCSGAGNVLKWYQTADNGLVTMPVSPTATTQYYAKCEITSNGITCMSGNSNNVTVTVLQPQPPVATGATICTSTSVTLTATGCSGSTGTFVLKWYQNSNDALVTMPVSPINNTDYYAKCEQTFNSVTAISAKSNVVTVTVLNPLPPVAAGGTIYSGNAITLTATGCTGTGFVIKWYQTADNALVTMPVSPTVTTQYYAKCEQTMNSITCLSVKSNDVTVTVVNRIFVDITKIAAPLQNGNSWATAYGNLQTGLEAGATMVLTAPVEVWVAKGTYKPTTTTTRTIYFNIPTNVKVFGGFAGTENALNDRNFRTNTTILSGDIGTVGVASDNSYHVAIFDGSSNTTVLDGFTITGGYANFDPKRVVNAPVVAPPTATPIDIGGGIVIQNGGMPMIANCTIVNNAAVIGGGIYASNASMPNIVACKIMSNQATFGAGIYFQDGSNGRVNNTLISGNRGIGAIYNNKSNSTITNCTIAGNGGYNGGIFNASSQPIVKNTIIWNNSTPFNDTQSIITYSDIQGGYAGTGNISYDPKFVSPVADGLSPTLNGDYHLQASSLAIDRGDNAGISLTDTDLDGNLRRYNGSTVDMGAYEFQGTATSNIIISAQTGDWEISSTWVGFKVPQLGDVVIIDANHIVTINATAIAKSIEYRGTGQIKFKTAVAQLNIGF